MELHLLIKAKTYGFIEVDCRMEYMVRDQKDFMKTNGHNFERMSNSCSLVTNILDEGRRALKAMARAEMAKAQTRQRIQANKHRRKEDFGIGDYVMVTTKHWNLRRPTRKLAEQSVGPFRIMERVGNAYNKLDLPDSIKVHPVFDCAGLPN